MMAILPAIDIQDGRVVRLYQGDYAQVTTFPDSVIAVGRRWAAEGAPWLHVVDLDGAKAGRPVNTDLILQLRQALTLQIEVGGGLRTPAAVDTLLDAGVDRVILGTAALHDTALLDYVLTRGGDRLAVALDARDGIVATAGWLQTSNQRAEAVAAALAARGVRVFGHTDIARDGALAGPNYAALRSLQAALPQDGAVQLIAAGGVSSLDQIRILRRMGLAGAIIGRALYTGAVRLPDAIAAAREAEEEAIRE